MHTLQHASYTPWWAKACVMLDVAMHLIALIVSQKQTSSNFIVFLHSLKTEDNWALSKHCPSAWMEGLLTDSTLITKDFGCRPVAWRSLRGLIKPPKTQLMGEYFEPEHCCFKWTLPRSNYSNVRYDIIAS